MNGAHGSAQGPGEPLVRAPGISDPDLDHLIRALTASGYPHELTGRDAALAAFRAASAEHDRTAGRARRARGPRRFLLPARAAAVTGAGLAVLAGFTAAAYAQALPASVQRIAHSVLAPLGVPDSEQRPAGHHTAPQRSASGPAPSAAAHVPATAPASAALPTALPSRPSPSAVASSPVTAPAMPSIQLQLVPGHTMDHLIVTVSAPSARPGGTVLLAELTGGSWQTVGSRSRGGSTRIDFPIRASSAMGSLFRAGLLEPGGSSPIESNVVSVPDSAAGHPGK